MSRVPFASDDTPAVNVDHTAAVGLVFLRAVPVAFLWMLQYGLWVWCVYAWRLTAWAFKALGFTAVLLFIPVIGWLILWAILRGRKRDRQHEELVRTLKGIGTDGYGDPSGSLWRPWLIDWVKAPLAVTS